MDLKGGWIKVQNVFPINKKEIIKVKLNTLTDVKNFVNLAGKLNDEVIVYSGHYVVDGKSLMGILSLALNYMIDVRVVNKEEKEKFIQGLDKLDISFAYMKE